MTESIVVTSNEEWGDVWYSKQHYANELSKLDYKVFFLNPPKRWRPTNLISFGVSIREERENLFIVDYRNNFPVRIFPKVFVRLNDFLNSLKLIRIVKEKALWWQFDPFRFINVYFRARKRIYHVVDPYDRHWMDKEIAKRADLVVVVSRFYQERYKSLNNRVLVVPHGISEDELILEEKKLKDKSTEVGKDYLLFIGTINRDVNLELLGLAAEKFSAHSLILIGPLVPSLEEKDKACFDELIKMENVIYLGVRNSKDLKYYIANSKVCLVPYKFKMDWHVFRSPLKILNYIAQKKPVVTSIEFEVENMENLGVYCEKDNESFISRTKALLNIVSITREQEKNIDNFQLNIRYPKLINSIIIKLLDSIPT